jgi:glutathionyl-hydroquinone reductase
MTNQRCPPRLEISRCHAVEVSKKLMPRRYRDTMEKKLNRVRDGINNMLYKTSFFLQ